MSDIHVGCGLFGIYAGKIRTDKEGNKVWSGEKTNVTDEAVGAVAQYLLDRDEVFTFEYKGKRYAMDVREDTGESE